MPCKQLLPYIAQPRWTLLRSRKNEPVVPAYTSDADTTINTIRIHGLTIPSIDDRIFSEKDFNRLLKMVCRSYMKWIDNPVDYVDYFGNGVPFVVMRTAQHKREQFRTLREWLNFSRNGHSGILCEHIPESFLSDHTRSTNPDVS